jgi:hypothetical protein
MLEAFIKRLLHDLEEALGQMAMEIDQALAENSQIARQGGGGIQQQRDNQLVDAGDAGLEEVQEAQQYARLQRHVDDGAQMAAQGDEVIERVFALAAQPIEDFVYGRRIDWQGFVWRHASQVGWAQYRSILEEFGGSDLSSAARAGRSMVFSPFGQFCDGPLAEMRYKSAC